MSDESLFDPDAPRMGPFARESSTSRRAAIDNYPRGGTQRRGIVDAVAASETGLTRDELATQLDMPLQTVCARVAEFLDGGYFEERGDERPTRRKSSAKVLTLTDAARAEIARWMTLDDDGGAA